MRTVLGLLTRVVKPGLGRERSRDEPDPFRKGKASALLFFVPLFVAPFGAPFQRRKAASATDHIKRNDPRRDDPVDDGGQDRRDHGCRGHLAPQHRARRG